MLKTVLLFLGVLASASASANILTVEGRASLELGVDKAREMAINNALVEASYRNNVKVSAVTEVSNLSVVSDSNHLSSTSIISGFKVVGDYACAPYYCVELEVDVTSDIAPVKVFSAAKVNLSVTQKGVATEDESALYGALYGELEQYLIQSNELEVVESGGEYSVDVSFQYSSVEPSFFDFLGTEGGNLVANINVSSGKKKKRSFVHSDDLVVLEQGMSREDMHLFVEKVARAISFRLGEVPLDGEFYVSNVVGDRVFIQANQAAVGMPVIAAFEDLKTGDLVRINGFVKSVFKKDAIIQLTNPPQSFYRIKSLKRMSGEGLSLPMSVVE